MSVWILSQILFNLLFIVFLFILWARLSREPQEDPRLSRGLQVLQTKISILEDLSDRTDKQVQDLCNIIEKKSKSIESAIISADEMIEKVNTSIKKSLEVAEIFEDKIPHDEIIERKNSKKYIQAAIMAHNGSSVEEIAQKIDLSAAEIELIIKVNKDRLMFSEENLPHWAKAKPEKDYSDVFNENHYEELKSLGDKFRSISMNDTKQEKDPAVDVLYSQSEEVKPDVEKIVLSNLS